MADQFVLDICPGHLSSITPKYIGTDWVVRDKAKGPPEDFK